MSEAVQDAFQSAMEGGGEEDGEADPALIGGADGPAATVSVEMAQGVAWG